MGYTYTCDFCDGPMESLPAFVGELREQWFKTTELGGVLADQGHSPGETLTVCGPCIADRLTDR